MKTTAVAPSNIAFIKYWGKKDGTLRLPSNGSISMNLSNLLTTTTVEFSSSLDEDLVTIDDTSYSGSSEQAKRVVKHLDRIRMLANVNQKAKIVSTNNFPVGTGLSSSASGFAALTVAAAIATGLEISEKQLSMLARKGSGSACRSIPDGFVEWLDGDTDETSYSVSLHEPDYWHIVDVVAVISREQKEVSSTLGQKFASTSPFFQTRLSCIENKILKAKELIEEKNFIEFGELIEAEAIELHAIMLTSTPSLIYWQPETIRLMKLVKHWRTQGFPVYFTLNTGQDIHLICEKVNVDDLKSRLNQVPEVMSVIVNDPSRGAKIIDDHLF